MKYLKDLIKLMNNFIENDFSKEDEVDINNNINLN